MTRFARMSSVAVAVTTCAGFTFGQSFNIDLGDPFGAFGIPGATYGAASGQVGTWTSFAPAAVGPGMFTLMDLTGAASSVTGTFTTSMGGNSVGTFEFDNAGTTGDDQALMDDLHDIGNDGLASSVTWTFSGLNNGTYDVYSYCFAPDSGAFQTDVTAMNSADPTQTSGGAWPGMHVQGVTYALHRVTVTGGNPDIVIDYLSTDDQVNANFGSVNGIQIVDIGVMDIGSTFCQTSPNSAGPGAFITAQGSTSVADMTVALTATGLPPNVSGIFYYGTMPTTQPFGDGFRCVAGVIQRLPFNTADGAGTMSEPNVFAQPTPNLPIAPGVLNFQAWYRDAPAMMSGFNLSDGVTVTFAP